MARRTHSLARLAAAALGCVALLAAGVAVAATPAAGAACVRSGTTSVVGGEVLLLCDSVKGKLVWTRVTENRSCPTAGRRATFTYGGGKLTLVCTKVGAKRLWRTVAPVAKASGGTGDGSGSGGGGGANRWATGCSGTGTVRLKSSPMEFEDFDRMGQEGAPGDNPSRREPTRQDRDRHPPVSRDL